MRAASKSRGLAKIPVRPALWFCACNLLAAVLAAQCSNPTQVPNGTYTSGDHSYRDNNALSASNFVLSGSATATLVAGNCIQLLPGFHATAGTAGTTFHAWVETVPADVSFSPLSGSGLSQPFTWTVSSPSGYSNLSDVYALFNTTSASTVNACYIRYNRASNLLYLADNSGLTWLGGFLPGSASSWAANSYCTIYGSGSSFSTSGIQLAVTVSVTFQTSFAGTKNEYLIGYDNAGLNTTWQQFGTWTVPAPPQYYLTTAVSPSVGGTISPASRWYDYGSVVPITAYPASGYQFSGFTGSVYSGSNPLSVTMNSAMTETANFTPVQYQLTTSVSPSGGGTIALSPPGPWYSPGTSVTVTAAPASGYQFGSFTGSVNSGSNPLTVTMNGPISETANFAVPMGTSSYLQANLGWISFNPYDTAHAASSEFNASPSSCPSGASVESCIQTILGQLRAQGVTGVRVFIPLCEAFPNCGPSSSWNPGTGTGQSPAQQTWINNVGNFFQDVANAGIANVTITITPSGPQYSLPASSTSSPNGSCASGKCCTDTGSTVLFDPLIPYGMASSDGFTIGDYWKTSSNQGYNCAPINSQFFIGWTNYFNAINAILGAARGRVNVYGFEIAQELDTMSFTAMMRYFYDNSSPTTAPSQYIQTVQTPNGPVSYANVLFALRSLMTANGFDPGRAMYSGAWTNASAAGANCINVYTDYARNGALDNITQTINGGPVGVPTGWYGDNSLTCGGTITPDMVTSPLYSSQPNIVDIHIYPQVEGTANTDPMIQQEAAIDYGDVTHFLALAGLQSATIVIGETYGGTLSPLILGSPPQYCWFGTYPSPPGAPYDNVAGFNNEGVTNPLSNYTVTFRPWMNLQPASGACFAYGSGPGTPGNYQAINYNGQGPYAPTNK